MKSIPFLFLVAIIVILTAQSASAESLVPTIQINTNAPGEVTNTEIYSGLKLAFLLTALTFVPSIIMTTTCFTRIAIVLAMTRQGLGLAQTPPNQVLLGLAFFLTSAIMAPIFEKVYNESIVPYSEDQISHKEAYDRAFAPLREFMLRHTREQDLKLFIEITKSEPPELPEQLQANVVVPAFLLSELNSAFQIGFLIFLPFLILDMIISSVLTSMSMITLPPTVISLPIKLMLFVVIDGWSLVITNLVRSYH